MWSLYSFSSARRSDRVCLEIPRNYTRVSSHWLLTVTHDIDVFVLVHGGQELFCDVFFEMSDSGEGGAANKLALQIRMQRR